MIDGRLVLVRSVLRLIAAISSLVVFVFGAVLGFRGEYAQATFYIALAIAFEVSEKRL